MYSANGRLKTNKEVAKEKQNISIMICNKCGAKELRQKVFGEVTRCATCGSEDVEFTME